MKVVCDFEALSEAASALGYITGTSLVTIQILAAQPTKAVVVLKQLTLKGLYARR